MGMPECVCDYEPAEVYSVETRKARKKHRCNECSSSIAPGERYEYVWAIWEGEPSTAKTCCRCLDLRNYIKAHVPCFCWEHFNMIENAIETAEVYAHEAPGLLFGAYRRQVLIHRAAAVAQKEEA